MSDLLTTGQRTEIRAALSDVADTFNKTPIVYRKLTAIQDRFNEDRDEGVYTDYNLLAQLEYGIIRENDRFELTDEGIMDKTTIRLTLNVDALPVALWDAVNNVANMIGESDKLVVSGREYYFTQVAYDGYFEAKPILVVIYADPKPRKT